MTTHSRLTTGSTVDRQLPDHLVELPGGEWAVWKWLCLRASGFSCHLVLQLAASGCGVAADRALFLEREAENARKESLEAFRLALEQTTDEGKRRCLLRALKQLSRGRTPEEMSTSLKPFRNQFADLSLQAKDAGNQFQREFQSSVLDISTKVRNIGGDSRFRQAVLLQNREALRRVARSFAQYPTGQSKRGFKERQNEELIANYLQRYCLKNDTIGFFGPVGWAKVVSGKADLVVKPGPALVSTSSIRFENWCIEALANKMAENKSLRPWMAPRLLPYFSIDRNSLYSPGGISTGLGSLHAEILRRCNGDKTARQIALEVLALTPNIVRVESQVYATLNDLESKGIICWSFEVPICLHPERRLRNLLEQIEKEELREPLVEQLNVLDKHRENINLAVGDADKLDRAIEDMDKIFTQITGRAPSKSPGAMYASRTLIYQDCQRDLRVEIGSDFIAALGSPLSLLLSSARWFTYRAAAAYRQAFEKTYRELCQKSDSGSVDLLQFWARIEPLLFDPDRRVFNGVVADFQNRWEQIFRLPNGQRRVEYRAAELKPLIDGFFAAPHAGWQLAAYHSPDVMIAATSIEAINAGDYQFVLGEVHLATNTLRFSFAVSQHPHPEELFVAIKHDLPAPRVLPVPPKRWPRYTNRTAIVLRSPEDYCLEVSCDSPADCLRSQVIPVSSLLVKNSPNGLVVQTRDRSLEFDIIEFFGEILSGAAVELMKIMHPCKYTPRVSIDRLIVSRESWLFLARDIHFINEEDEHRRYLEARRWMGTHDLPRFVFVKVPVEIKPFYVDFDSPIYVEILVKMIRRVLARDRALGQFTVTEMLPAPRHVWLPDAEGNTYTSELRMVMRDLVKF